MTNIFKRLAMAPILAYRILLRPLLPNACVFEPSCSEYALQSIERYGALRGSWMGFKRILRCHPWQHNHYDPVP